jgi:hypothetical protein
MNQYEYYAIGPTPVTVQSKTKFCGRLIVGIADTNPTEVKDFRCVLCRKRSLRQADLSFRGIAPCLRVCV